MKTLKRLIIVMLIHIYLLPVVGKDNDLFMDFRNQKITDIIYALADICNESVFIDETVTGNATFHFEDKDFESALYRFGQYCHMYIEKDDSVYKVSMVKLEISEEGHLDINTENVAVEPFLNMLSRNTNSTILFDSLPNANITIRVQNAKLEDVLNLTLVKLPGFALERIASGFYLTKSSGNTARRNVDVFSLSEVNGLYSMVIQRANFSNVIDTLFKKGKKEYSLLYKQNLQIEMMQYENKTFDELLTLILEQANCDYSISNDVYYIFEIQRRDITKKYKETKIIQLKYINSDNLVSLLPAEYNSSGFMKIDKISNCVILTGSNSEIAPLENFIERIDAENKGVYYKRFDVENIDVKEAASLIPKYLLISDITILPSDTGFITQVTSETEKELNSFISILDSRKQSYAVTLKYIKSDDLLKALPPSVTKDSIVQTNEPTLVFFKGADKQYKDFLNDLEKIDQPKQQIKYQLLVIQRQKTNAFNWNSTLSGGSTKEAAGYSLKGMLSNIFNINFDIIAQFGMQFAGSLNAELSEGKSHVLADTTLNGISGESISFSNTNTYRYRDIIVDTSGDLYTSTTREIASGLTLNINGWVSGDEMITVNVDAQISKQGSVDSSSTNTSNPPSTSEKKVSTNVRTKSGEPVIIGGLFQQETDINDKGIPGVKDIPIAGNLFKGKNISVADTEFVIYLIPFVEKDKNRELTVEKNLQRLKEKYEKAVVEE